MQVDRDRHIVIVAHFAGSPYHGMVTGYYYLSQEWLKKGYEVTILASGYAHTRYQNPDVRFPYSVEFIDGIRYVWLKTPSYEASGRFGRVFNILAFSFLGLFVSLPIRSASAIICSSHHPASIFISEKLSKKFSVPLIFEVRDLWPLTLIELGGASVRNPFIRLLQYCEDRAYRNSARVVSVLSHASPYMQSRGMDKDKFEYIPNGVVVDSQSPDRSESAERSKYFGIVDELKSNGNFVIGYAGRLGLANALHQLVDALTYCDHKIHAVLLGGGPYVSILKEKVTQLGLESRVHFINYVPKDLVSLFLEKVDIAYLGLQETPLFYHGISPTKLGDYLLAGKPVLAAYPDPERLVENIGCGYSCSSDDPQAMAEAISKLVSCGEPLLNEMGKKGRDWILENRNYATLAEKFLELIRQEAARS